MDNFRYFRLLGETPFNVRLMSCHWPCINCRVEFMVVLKSNCCHFARALASVGLSLPHVAWKPIFDTGTLKRLTSEIRITLPFSTASIASTRPAKPTDPLFKMKYCVCAGLNSVKTNSSCLSLTACTTPASVLVLFMIVVCCFQNVLSFAYRVPVVSQAPQFCFLQLLLCNEVVDLTRFSI